jgi:transposase
MTAPMVLDGPMNREAFIAYASQVLGPTLAPGDIVIMDNLPAHKGDAVRQAIEATGATLVFLPPYSPDFNPIENAFAKLKALLRKAADEPSKASGERSEQSSKPSRPANARTTSWLLGTSRNNVKML